MSHAAVRQPRRARRIAVATMGAIPFVAGGLVLGATPASATTDITSCTTAAVQLAPKTGGNWAFTCSGTIWSPSPTASRCRPPCLASRTSPEWVTAPLRAQPPATRTREPPRF